MKIKILFALAVFTLSAFATSANAQSKNKTIVLVRHAEKSIAVTNDPDPELSDEGKERAQWLIKLANKYKPHEIFSTSYKRTRQTVEPIAAKRRKEIQTYDPAKSADLVAKIMASETNHNLIVGHSNTIPALANLIAKKEVFRNLLDTEYGVIWVIRLKKGVLRKIEVLPF